MKKNTNEKTRIWRSQIKKSSQIYNLYLCLDEDGIISVRGRLGKWNLSLDCKHPIVFLKGCVMSKLIITWCHKRTGHTSSGIALNKIRTSVFWIYFANSATFKFPHCM